MGGVSDVDRVPGPPVLPRPVNAGFGTTPFARLARTHFTSVVGDASFVIGLASSVFFSVDFSAARWRVGMFLLLTLVPFAVVAPLVGPAIDRARGGRRLMLIASCGMRAELRSTRLPDWANRRGRWWSGFPWTMMFA